MFLYVIISHVVYRALFYHSKMFFFPFCSRKRRNLRVYLDTCPRDTISSTSAAVNDATYRNYMINDREYGESFL